jgi:putative phosphoesterase
MRIAILADVHGNLRALEAVRSELRARAPDAVINLGDHVSGPLQAAASADLLMSESYQTICGNHDRQLLDRRPDQMGPSDRAAWSQLEMRHKDWLKALPSTATFNEILLCHGSPDNDLEYLLEDVIEDRLALAPGARIAQRLGASNARLVLCGHTHIPRMVRLESGVQIVNPGSVGLQAYDDTRPRLHYVETGSPHARYALLDREKTGWRVEFVAVEYDWDAAAQEASANRRPDWAYALATGYALRPSAGS